MLKILLIEKPYQKGLEYDGVLRIDIERVSRLIVLHGQSQIGIIREYFRCVCTQCLKGYHGILKLKNKSNDQSKEKIKLNLTCVLEKPPFSFLCVANQRTNGNAPAVSFLRTYVNRT